LSEKQLENLWRKVQCPIVNRQWAKKKIRKRSEKEGQKTSDQTTNQFLMGLKEQTELSSLRCRLVTCQFQLSSSQFVERPQTQQPKQLKSSQRPKPRANAKEIQIETKSPSQSIPHWPDFA